MLTAKQKEAILADKRFGQFEETLAIAALKRRLDFQRTHFTQSYYGAGILITTERSGRAFKIKWEFGKNVSTGYELLGFKTTRGFYPKECDTANNGSLVIQSFHTNELVEFLDEGQTYYYTLLLRPYGFVRRLFGEIYFVARFQVTMVTEDERRLVEAALQRIEERKAETPPKADPERDHIERALKEVGLFVEFDTALESKVRVLRREIDNSDSTAEEKRWKIERLQDVVNSIREKYEL
jgi:hypothetical protein